MKKIFTLLFLFIVIDTSFLFAQKVLTIEDSVTVSSLTGKWDGVNIPRTEPTTFTFKNNSITSVNSNGYLLQAGDEGLYDGTKTHHLDGEVITGNKFKWNGTDQTSITHALFTGYNINVTIKYNYLDNTPLGILRKSNGMTDSTGVIAYNIVINPKAAIIIKGINGIRVYNNTFYSNKTNQETNGTGLVDIFKNTDKGLNGSATGSKIFNNIFYTVKDVSAIRLLEDADLKEFESDYNVFYSETGNVWFNIQGERKTFAQWQAMGYDVHSVVVNPNFISNTFVPSHPLYDGKDLGSELKQGLSPVAKWGGTSPAVSSQDSKWQCGAYIVPSKSLNSEKIKKKESRKSRTH